MRNRSVIAIVACLAILGCVGEPPSESRPLSVEPNKAEIALSTGEDDYNRVLGISVTDLEGAYSVGSKIPITVRITDRGAADANQSSKYPTAQLFPHLTVWIEKNSELTTDRIPLPIENRIWIKRGETFEREIDLSRVKSLSVPGEYEVSIGHENWTVKDLGDWTGTLRSRSQTIVIKNRE